MNDVRAAGMKAPRDRYSGALEREREAGRDEARAALAQALVGAPVGERRGAGPRGRPTRVRVRARP